MCSRPTSTTTTSPAGWPWPGRRARPTTSTPRTRWHLTGYPSPAATWCRSGRRCGCARSPPPGHTFTHLAYALEYPATGETVAVFTGGSLLHGSAGRPDLFGAAHTHALAAAQHTSVRRLATNLPAQAAVYPTHGFGSFRAPAGPGADGSTIGEERRVNPALALDEDAYIAWLLAGLDDYPAYYAQMGPANAAGPAAPDLSLIHI